nr:unnamed protein product [Callosobruchus chinensis]
MWRRWLKEYKYVKLWVMKSFEIKAAHQQHVESNRTVAAAFAGSHRIVSTGKVVSQLRGHDKEVISTDWCPIPSRVTQTPALEKQIPATVSETSTDVQISSCSLTRFSAKARSTESLSSDTQQVLDMADSAAAQSAPETPTEMTPGANVDEKKRLNKGIPKLQDLVALSLFAKKPYCEKCGKEVCACVNTAKTITANVEQAR